jgi:hypothetical protein
MITRIWRGWTEQDNAEAYERLLLGTILPSIEKRGIVGYRGAYLYRRTDGDLIEFMTTMFFDSIEAVKAFAGEEFDIAVVPSAARRLLAHFDTRSAHYEMRSGAEKVSA